MVRNEGHRRCGWKTRREIPHSGSERGMFAQEMRRSTLGQSVRVIGRRGSLLSHEVDGGKSNYAADVAGERQRGELGRRERHNDTTRVLTGGAGATSAPFR